MTNLCRIAFLAGVLLCIGPSSSQTQEQTQFLQHLKSAILHLQNRELPLAKSELEAALAIDSRAPNALTLLGLVYESSGKLNIAVQYHQKALSVDPEFKVARNNLGSSYYRLGKASFALREFQRVLELDPKDLTANFNVGRIHLERRQYLQAEHRLASARAVAPSDAGVLLGLAECYFNLDRPTEAEEALSALSAESGHQPEVTFRQGVLLLSHGREEKALEYLLQANEMAPRNPAILVSLAKAQFATAKTDDAVKSIDAFIGSLRNFGLSGSVRSERTRPLIERAKSVLFGVRNAGVRSTGIDILYAETLYLLHEYSQAVQVLEPRNEDAGDDPNFLNLLGMNYAGLGDYQAAIQTLKEALKQDPQRLDLLFNLGTVFQKAGQNATARQIFERLIDVDPDSAPVLFALAVSRFHAGEFSVAAANLEELLEIAPQLQEARIFLGRCFKNLGRTGRAAKVYEEAMELDIGCGECRFRLAKLQLETEDVERASENFRTLIEFDPKHVEAHYELGKILRAAGEYADAIRMLETAIRLDSTHDGAYYQLGRIFAQLGDNKRASELLNMLTNNKEKRLKDYQERVSVSEDVAPQR